MSRTRLFVASSVSVLALVAQAAHAESGEKLEVETSDESAGEAGAGDDNMIIVTGAKMNRSLQDTPVSVDVATADDIRDEDIISLDDVLDRAANVSSNGGVTIRGIRGTNVSGAGIGTLATTYVDGSPGAATDIWDLEQAEVFRGPQSTLQGRNTLAGAIFLTTANPSNYWTGRARAIIGTGDHTKRFGAAIGGPIIEDQVSFRLAGEVVDTKGLVDNLTLGEKADGLSSKFIRGKLQVEPDLLPGFSALASYTYDKRNQSYSPSLYLVDNPHKNRVIYSNRPSPFEVASEIAVLNLDYEITSGLSVKSITGKNSARSIYSYDGDNGPEEYGFGDYDRQNTNFTQEFRLTLNEGPLTGVAGVYYSRAKIRYNEPTTSVFGFDTTNTINANIIAAALQGLGYDSATAAYVGGIVAPYYAAPILIGSSQDNPSTITTKAFFADATYEASDKIKIFAGMRYDTEKQRIATGNSVAIAQELPNRTNLPVQLTPFYDIFDFVNANVTALAQQATAQPEELKSPTFGAFLPKIGIGYALNDDANLSFIVQRGYRSGGVGVNSARANTFDFDQEFIWNYELSFRSQWFDNALTLNANAFYIDWTDQQVSIQLSGNTFDSETVNAGSSEVYGFEIESSYSSSDTLTIYGSVGYAKSKFKDFSALINNVEVDLSGNSFAFAPKWTLAGGATWKPENGIFVNVNVNYNTAAFRRADEVQTERDLASRLLANFKIGWQNENFGIFVTGKNILNDKQITSLNYSPRAAVNMPDLVKYTDPQTFAIQIEASF